MVFIIFLVLSFPMAACSSEKNISFQSLENRLINDKKTNFTEARINRIYNNPGVFFDIKGVASYFRHQESSLNYDQFLSSKSIQRASDYMRNHYAPLLKAEIGLRRGQGSHHGDYAGGNPVRQLCGQPAGHLYPLHHGRP